MVIGDRSTTRHLSHSGSPIQPVGAPPMCTGQRNFVTALVRLNAKIRDHKAHKCHGLPSYYRREAILPLALSYFQSDKISRRLVGIRQGSPRYSGSPSSKYGATAADV